MITDVMKLMEHYWMYVALFRVDVPMTQSEPIESTQGTHKTTSAPRTPNPDVAEGVSSYSPGYKETPEVEVTTAVQPVNVNKEEEESAEDDYELRRQEKGKEIRFMPRKKFNVLAQHLQDIMEDSLPKMVDDRVKELTKKQDDHYDDTHPKGENDAKRQKTSKHETYMSRESSSGQVNESEPVHQRRKVSKELVDEMSQTVNEAKLCKVVNEMLRQRCTLGDEHC
nr:hypothetical protein [Tanacetum cinerariifolium]